MLDRRRFLGTAVLGSMLAALTASVPASAAPEPTKAAKLADAMARAQAACAEITALLGQEWKPQPTARGLDSRFGTVTLHVSNLGPGLVDSVAPETMTFRRTWTNEDLERIRRDGPSDPLEAAVFQKL
jgi:hypothetical protein